MSYYVRIPRINGRMDHYHLNIWLRDSGINEVDYCEGGWSDGHLYNLAPHLKFEREEDATAYVLAKGGEFSRDLPVMKPANDSGK